MPDTASSSDIINNFAENLLNNQQPLGKDFEKIWDDNLDSLLITDEATASTISPVYSPLEAEFLKLVAEWDADTKFLFSSTEIMQHPAYEKIISMGPDVVPLILESMQSTPRFWFDALKQLTGEDPIPPIHYGDINLMTQDWLNYKNTSDTEESGLCRHAKRELELAGLFDKDSDYNGMLGDAVLELMKVFSKQGHSGYSASMVTELFSILSRYQILNRENFIPTIEDANDVSEASGLPIGTMWQSTRLSSVFSNDGGNSWYDVEDPEWHFVHLTIKE